MLPTSLAAATASALAAATALAAVTNWWSVATGRLRVESWTKPLTLLLLPLTAAAVGALAEPAGRWLVVALLLGLLGDVALLGGTRARLLAGIAAFLLGHLAYLVCFLTLGLPWPAWAWGGLAVLALVTLVTRRVVPAAYRVAGASVAVPLTAYTLVIAAMLLVAWGTGLWLVAAGATIFVVSDSIIALTLVEHDFDRPRGSDHVAVMVTYHVGQALIVGGVLLAAG